MSVRSAAEALEALAGGADILDVKEPARGALGCASLAVRDAVVHAAASRAPVTAALGELAERPPAAIGGGIAYYKLGLSGAAGTDWPGELARRRRLLREHGADLVAAAYADWECAGAPRPLEVLEFAAREKLGAILLDTFDKRGGTLFDRIEAALLERWIARARAAGIQVAVAGSLRREHVPAAIALGAGIIAVRGAAAGGDRGGAVERRFVSSLAREVRRKATSSPRRAPSRSARLDGG